MTNSDIVKDLYKSKFVINLIIKMEGLQKNKESHADLEQLIYLTLLEKPEGWCDDMKKMGYLYGYINRFIRNQIISEREYRKTFICGKVDGKDYVDINCIDISIENDDIDDIKINKILESLDIDDKKMKNRSYKFNKFLIEEEELLGLSVVYIDKEMLKKQLCYIILKKFINKPKEQTWEEFGRMVGLQRQTLWNYINYAKQSIRNDYNNFINDNSSIL